MADQSTSSSSLSLMLLFSCDPKLARVANQKPQNGSSGRKSAAQPADLRGALILQAGRDGLIRRDLVEMANTTPNGASAPVHQHPYSDNPCLNNEKVEAEEQGFRTSRSRRGRSTIVLCVIGFMIYSLAQTVIVTNWWNARKSDVDAPAAEEKVCNEKRQYETPEPEAELCLTADCIHAASYYLKNIHPDYENIDPCTNFDEYACGGWYEQYDIPSDAASVSTLDTVSDQALTMLHHILEAPQSNSTDENFAKLKAGYDACMDEETLDKIGAAPLQELLDSVKLADVEQDSFTDAYLGLLDLSISDPFSLFIVADETDPDSVILYMGAPSTIGLPSIEAYNDTELVERYSAVVEEVLGVFETGSGASSRVKRAAADVVGFETKLAAATQPPEDAPNDPFPKVPLSEAQKLIPQLSLEKVISTRAPEGYEAKEIVVPAPWYLEQVSALLAESSADTVLSYLKWKVIQYFSGSIEDPKILEYRRFNNELEGKDPDAFGERWEKCVAAVDVDLGWILSGVYIEKAFSEESKKFGDQIVSDIKERFVDKLNNTDWISSDVRDTAIEKVGNIVQKIGYSTESPDVRDPEDIKEYYSSLSIANNTFFDNSVAAASFYNKREWSKLGKPTDRDEWVMTMPTVNAYYNPPGNEIVFPAGIMQTPIFYPKAVPQYLTYGAFAAVAGHELTHAFDSTGRNYDQNGKLTDWWDNKTETEFVKRSDCFVEQYSKFTITNPDGEELHVNGDLTLGENIADAGGLKAAFQAWKIHDKATPNQKLPGMDKFTKEQIFFLSYGSTWCGKSTAERSETRIFTDPHAPPFARILGTTANSPDFREAFNCPVKEPTCDLW
ncbi:hypothetical protein FQN51_008081 [Onygenales sp. PD_10]|nr:hypothetical protein FQN51_008081 [Onygenales sp. PD_10]